MLTKHVEIRYARSRTTSRNAIGTQFPHSSFCFFSGTNVKIKFFLAFSLTSSHLLATCSLSSALASAPLFLFRLFRFRFLPLISPADNFFFSYPSPTNHHKTFFKLAEEHPRTFSGARTDSSRFEFLLSQKHPVLTQRGPVIIITIYSSRAANGRRIESKRPSERKPGMGGGS